MPCQKRHCPPRPRVLTRDTVGDHDTPCDSGVHLATYRGPIQSSARYSLWLHVSNTPRPMPNTQHFTSESVSEGHPDKVADQISDAIVDALLTIDPASRVACETLVNTRMVVLSGEISSSASIDAAAVARETLRGIGYTSPQLGCDADTVAVLLALNEQSPDIAIGVDQDADGGQGAGDQGTVFGFACDETDTYMPAAIDLSHRLMRRQAECRKSRVLDWLRPDAKSQLSLRYQDGEPVAIEAVVLSTQHDPDITPECLREAVMEEIIKPVLPEKWLGKDTQYHINPTGRFVIGGPMADCGLTGRKIIVDTYGGMARHGGGAFSGKDPSKVDRSAAYACRHVAKNLVAAGLTRRCELQLSYAIGVAEPVAIGLQTFGSSQYGEEFLVQLVREHFDLRPGAIIEALDLMRPIYQQTAAYGHFGRDELQLPWEQTNYAETLREAVPGPRLGAQDHTGQ